MKKDLIWVEISEKNLLNNLAEFRKILPSGVKFMAVVKANAYGHGLAEMGKILKEKTDWFGVNNLEEALTLKKIGVRKPILILGYTPLSQLKEVIKNEIRQVVYNQETVDVIYQCINTLIKKPVKIHLKIETGTNRQGVDKGQILDLAKFIKQYPQIEIEGVYTHFANIEDTTNYHFAHKQLTAFKEAISLLEEDGFNISLKHTACSAASILFPETYFDMVRVGISLYGLWPSKETKISAQERGKSLNLKPVLTWKTRVAQIKKVKKGESVGYGCAFKASRDLKIAVLPIGYFDGYDRRFSNCGQVLIKGEVAPVTGRVCMNMVMVDITEVPGVEVEDEAVLLGKQGEKEVTVDDLAEKIGTINYEIVSRINPLLPRIIV